MKQEDINEVMWNSLPEWKKEQLRSQKSFPAENEKSQQKDSADVCVFCGCEIGEFHRKGCRWYGRGNLFNG